MLQTLRDLGSFARWRLKPKRWAVKALYSVGTAPRRWRNRTTRPIPASSWAEQLREHGFVKLDAAIALPQINIASHRGAANGAAFVDLRTRHREEVDGAVIALLSDSRVGALVANYFDGRPWLWNVQLAYSEPSNRLQDSQLWHFDYSDNRQLHLIAYLSDVTDDSGPFTFLPKSVSESVKRHPLVIERKTDDELEREGVAPGEHAKRLIGKRGDLFATDPGVLMHQGARCRTERLVMFVTFTSIAPMSKGGRAALAREDRIKLGKKYLLAAPNGPLPPSTFA